MRRTLLALVVIAAIAVPSGGALAHSKPDATLKISGHSVAAGIGYSWGKGTLTYKGKHYPFNVDGLSLVDVGVSSVEANGTVYNLKHLDDFSGQYTAASASGALGGGAGVSAMKNQNGVRINLHATTRGVKFKAGPEGIKITLEK